MALKAQKSNILRTISETTEPRSPTPITNYYSINTIATSYTPNPTEPNVARSVLRSDEAEDGLKEPVIRMSSSLLVASSSAPLERFSDPLLPLSRSNQSLGKLERQASFEEDDEYSHAEVVYRPKYSRQDELRQSDEYDEEDSIDFNSSEPEDSNQTDKPNGVSWKV